MPNVFGLTVSQYKKIVRDPSVFLEVSCVSMRQILDQGAFLVSFVFPLQICSTNLTVYSEPNVSRRFRKLQELFYPKGRDNATLEKKLFQFVFLFRQIKPL